MTNKMTMIVAAMLLVLFGAFQVLHHGATLQEPLKGLKPSSGSGGAPAPSQPADAPGTGKDVGPHNLGN